MRDDDSIDQDERSERYRGSRRREKTSQRKKLYWGIFLLSLVAVVLAAPSVVSNSEFGRSLLQRNVQNYGFDAEVEDMQVGWFTPTQASGISLHGQNGGSEISVGQLDTEMTLLDLLRGSTSYGTIALRDVVVTCRVREGRSSIEDDLQALMAGLHEDPEFPEASSDAAPGHRVSSASSVDATIELTDVAVHVIDEVTGEVWDLNQASSRIVLDSVRTQASFGGVLTEPSGRAGSIQGVVEVVNLKSGNTLSTTRLDDIDAELKDVQSPWRVDITSESLPLSVLSLVRRRVGEDAELIPAILEGDASGEVVLTSGEDGSLEVSLTEFRVRNLSGIEIDSASGESRLLWRNELASMDGELSILPRHLVGRGLVAQTDFASASLDGIFLRDLSWVGSSDNPLRWLDGINGQAKVEVDLAKLQAAFPGVLPIRSDAQILTGRAIARVASQPPESPNQARLSQLSIKSHRVQATSSGRDFQIDPIEITASVVSDQGMVYAEEFRWQSSFGNAIGEGDLQEGKAKFDIDFEKLAQMLHPLLEFDEETLTGVAGGDIRWNTDENGRWHLNGDTTARDLVIRLPNGKRIVEPKILGKVDAVGKWANQSLTELSTAKIALTGEGMRFDVELLETLDHPSFDRPVSLRVEADGDAGKFFGWLRPLLPPPLESVQGRWTFTSKLNATTQSLVLENSSLMMMRPTVVYGGTSYWQPEARIDLDGSFRWPENTVEAQRLTIVADAFSAVMKGNASIHEIDGEIRWRAKLDRLIESVGSETPLHRQSNTTKTQTIAFQSRSPKQSAMQFPYGIRGDCEGACSVKTAGDRFFISHQTSGRDIEISDANAASASPSTLWFEPNLETSGEFVLDVAAGTLVSQQAKMATDWFASSIELKLDWNGERTRFHGNGPVKIDMEQFSKRTSGVAGVDWDAFGVHETELQIDWLQRGDQERIYTIDGTLGWDRCSVAGTTIEASNIPFVMTEKEIAIEKAVAKIGSGRMEAGGVLHYGDQATWIQLEPGSFVEEIELTQQMTFQWLKYLAPMVAQSARVQGTLSVELEKAIIDLSDSTKTEVIGKLNVSSAQMSAGPLANQMFGGLNQLIALAGGRSISPNTTLVTMPPQSVDFQVFDGTVSHQRMYFQIDNAKVITSGRVRIADSSMEMVAQIPIEERWLGGNLRGLAGQTITLPIQGTVSRPQLDSKAIGRMTAQLGVKALESKAESYLQKQLEKGLGSLFGK